MSNSYFEFRQFIVRQEHCAMKVGTDGTLLGAWAQAPVGATCRILDIGTGTGLIALMMAQRYGRAEVTGIDIDADAVAQAKDNAMKSPFSDRITILEGDVTTLQDSDGFDAIVCNPPYFANSLTSPDPQRTTARHMVTLDFQHLMVSAFRLLRLSGLFSLVIPTDFLPGLQTEANMVGFFTSRIYLVHTTTQKKSKRCLIELRKNPVSKLDKMDVVLENKQNVRSQWYQQLTQDFYIR